MVRHRPLEAAFVGPNPTSPAMCKEASVLRLTSVERSTSFALSPSVEKVEDSQLRGIQNQSRLTAVFIMLAGASRIVRWVVASRRI